MNPRPATPDHNANCACAACRANRSAERIVTAAINGWTVEEIAGMGGFSAAQVRRALEPRGLER